MRWELDENFRPGDFDVRSDALRDAAIALADAHQRLERAEEERADALRAMANAHGAMEAARTGILAVLPNVTLSEGSGE